MISSTAANNDGNNLEERTEVWHGHQEAVNKLLEVLSKARIGYEFCIDSKGPSIIVENEFIKKAYSSIKNRSGYIKLITEITPENIGYCKELMKFLKLRHLDKIKGNFGIVDKVIYGSGIADTENGRSPSECIFSTVTAFVSQQQYFFDMLWDKAISAEQKIKEIEEGIEPEITEIVTGWDNIFKRNINNLSKEKRRVDSCCDALVLSKIVKSPMYKASADYVKRGGKIRMITEITVENLSSVKELIKIQEIRHIDQFAINFGVSETVFTAPTYVYSMSSNPQCIYSNSKDLIKQHLYLFNTLWEKAVPAEEKIREIEQGIEHETIDTLRDHKEIQKLAYDLVKLAKDEVLIIFSTANAFHRQEKAGTIELLLNAAKARGVQTRILLPFDGNIVETVRKLEEQSQQKIKTRNIAPDMQTRISILIVDRKYALSAELKDDSKETSIEAMGLATYSNSNATVSSYVAIFESLWHHVEMYDLLRVHNERQREFINIAAHELRTPIQPILGLSGILCEKSDEHDREHQQLIEIIHRNANRLYRMTENLLDITRIESQHLQLNRERCNLGDLIREVITNMATLTGFKSVKLSFTTAEKDDRVDFLANVDRERIAQVLGNLLSNAAKFTKVGGIIVITLEEDGGIGGYSHDDYNNNDNNCNDYTRFAVVSVRDTGPGIDLEILPRLFEKFASKSEKGIGLGLFISRGIIEAHGGKIWAKNNDEDRNGATFAFTLPLVSKNLHH